MDTRGRADAISLDAGTAAPEELFARLPDPLARDRLARHYYPLAEYLARRFRAMGSDDQDDLTQVAAIGLLKAIDRFDGARGIRFSTYAVPTITGELKRHLRDCGWAMRLPRRLQERYLHVRSVLPQAQQELGRSPTIPELAARAGISPEQALEALESEAAQSLRSVDAPFDSTGSHLLDSLGGDDGGLAVAEGWSTVAPALRRLPERQRRLLHLRFVRGLPQGEIAEIMGVSQMHVSRLLAATLRDVREAIGEA